MPSFSLHFLTRVLVWLVVLVMIRVVVVVVSNYGDYVPPNFNSEFLHGREGHFFGLYAWAFYAHIVSGPLALLAGLLLLNARLRRRWPVFHRWLGRMQVVGVVGVMAPSGLVMALWAAAGPVATVSFITLSLATAGCLILGWRAAVTRRFALHERWMERAFVLLCSAVTLRLMVGTALVVDADFLWWDPLWFDPILSWVSWLLPLGIYEAWWRFARLPRPAERPRETS